MPSASIASMCCSTRSTFGQPKTCSRMAAPGPTKGDRKSTRLNSSHQIISYAVFCLKKKNMILSSLLFYFLYQFFILLFSLFFMFCAIAGGIASALAVGAMSKLFVGVQKFVFCGNQGHLLLHYNPTRRSSD